MKFFFLVCNLFFIMNITFGQTETLPLWEEGAIPNSQSSNEIENYPEREILWIEKVQKPTLAVFLPAKRVMTGRAVIICPGGGYQGLAYDWEGTDIAKWYNSKGIAAFVLKYRLPNSKSVVISNEAPLQDAQRAIRLVRFHAEKWNVNTDEIGIMGFSAGGHLASTLGTQFATPSNFKESKIDQISARPDFMVLLYPVVTMKEDYTHSGSRNSLLGKKPSLELIQKYSNEMQVTKDTPPTFIVHSGDDTAVPVENSLQLYKSLKDAGIKTEMHVYPYGGHGYALAIGKGRLQSWPDRLYDWLLAL